MKPLSILFVGETTPFLTTVARRDALIGFGHTVETIDQYHYVNSDTRWLQRLTFWSLLTPPVFAFNRDLLAAADRVKPDLAWIEKGTFVFPRTLRALKARGIPLVYHNTDDVEKPGTKERIHWRYLLRTLDLYDMHITSNHHNVKEFRERGLPNVHLMELCANEAVTVGDTPPTAEDRERLGGAVGFIGHWEPATERQLLHLVRAGIPVTIWGPHWEHAEAQQELADSIRGRGVYGHDYAKAIVSFDICCLSVVVCCH